MDFQKLSKYKIILASSSPRRRKLLKELGLNFEVQVKMVDESYPPGIAVEKVPEFLAEKKAMQYIEHIKENVLLITADTVVIINNTIVGKPENYDDAVKILKTLSGNRHTVITGVCILTSEKKKLFSVSSDVYFKTLREREISYYLHHYKPYDKAGAYGVQDWIGLIGLEKINGSYHNVMGLPVSELYEQLLSF